MNQNDLRVIKTKKAINDSFLKLLQNRPLSKISIAELARDAQINKGTFYLHYRDVYDLYQYALKDFLRHIADEITFLDLFFTDIESFAYKLYDLSISKNFFKNNPFFSPENAPYNMESMQLFCNILTDKVLSFGRLEPSEINRMKLISIFAGIGMLLRYDGDKSPKDVSSVIVCSYRGQFGNSDIDR